MFDSDDCKPSRFPIFRERNIVARDVAADRMPAELAQFTFTQWLDHYRTHPSFASQRRYMLSDERYVLLLNYVTSTHKRVVDYARAEQLNQQQEAWLHHALGENTYKYQLMEYKGKTVSDIDKGAVLVCFKEPAIRLGGKVCRRKPHSRTPMTVGLSRRCVPYSQIELVLDYCHTGALAKTMHFGQKSMWDRLSAEFDGISRQIVRMYVKKCLTCEQRQVRTHKAALVPITAKTLFERIVIDLIDFTLKPSHGYHYIFHAVDHCSKFHWAWAMQDKRPATVAYHLATLLADIGPVKHVQCDQGKEFVADVLGVLMEFGCGAPLRSAPYSPQGNGLVERGNGMLKDALDHWFVQENTSDWYPPLARIRYQLNCTKPRTTRCSPYELVYSRKPPAWEGLELVKPLQDDTLTRVLTQTTSAPCAAGTLTTTDAPPTESAANILSTMARPTLSSQLPDPVSQLPAEDSEYVYPDQVGDVPAGTDGPLNKTMADELNIGGCHFVRLGGEGYGRCGISAFYNAYAPMDYVALAGAERRRQYDTVRKELRQEWEALNTDTRPASVAKRKLLRDMIYELGNSGGSHDEAVEVRASASSVGELQREEA